MRTRARTQTIFASNRSSVCITQGFFVETLFKSLYKRFIVVAIKIHPIILRVHLFRIKFKLNSFGHSLGVCVCMCAVPIVRCFVFYFYLIIPMLNSMVVVCVFFLFNSSAEFCILCSILPCFFLLLSTALHSLHLSVST